MAEATAGETQQAQEVQEAQETPQDAQPQAVEVNEAELPEAVDTGDRADGGQIDILLDTMLGVSARMGQAEVKIRDLLAMGPGSVLELDKKVGEPIDLYLRGIRFASGSLVVVGDQLGVKIREILPSGAVGEGQQAADG